MDRKDTTQFLSDLLISQKLTGLGKHYASEVTLGYGQGKNKTKRVDFIQFVPKNQLCVAGIEKGYFIFYEVKSCKEDFYSGHGLNFEGDKNYLVTTMEVYKEIIHELDKKLPHYVGIMVAVPYRVKPEDEFQNPTSLDEMEIDWKLEVVRNSFDGYRKRSMTELLFCMLRAGK
jgi:hypothetical protein